MKIKTKDGIAEPFPASDLQKNNRLLKSLTIGLEKNNVWFKTVAITFAILVIFLIVSVLWLKFSGVGHNMVWELSSGLR